MKKIQNWEFQIFQKSQLWFYAYLSNIWWYLRLPITPISRSLKIINFGRFFGIIPNWESWVWVTKVAYSVSRRYDFYKIMVILLVKSSNIKNPQILAPLNLPCKQFKTFYHSKIASLPTEILYWSWKMSKKSYSYIFIWWLNGRFLNQKCSQCIIKKFGGTGITIRQWALNGHFSTITLSIFWQFKIHVCNLRVSVV